MASVLAAGAILLLSPSEAHADLDCGDFSYQAAAQGAYIAAGGPTSDPNGLDADGDGIACESNPCPCSKGGPASPPPPPVIPPPEEPAPEPRTVFWKSFGEPAEVEPATVGINTGVGSGVFSVRQLRVWHGWGSKEAWAFGKLRIKDCKPDCATGGYVLHRARLVLTKIRANCGQPRYMEVKIRVFGFRTPVLGPLGSDCRGAQVVRTGH